MPQTSPLQVTLSGAGKPSQVQVAGRGVGSTPTLPHAPPLWPCREEAPGGGLLRREAAGGAAAVLTSPSRYQLIVPQPVAPPPPFPCAGFQVAVVGAEGGSTPLGRDGWESIGIGSSGTRMKVGALEQGGRVESTPSLTSSSLLFPFPPSSTLPGPQRSLSLC
ncbi:unnamed protein product [Closterium sp. NIES-64]|nr:unnamed protein product [Closterium sp. NIES-64]